MNQTILPSKVIVIDDGSTDRTPEILERFRRHYPDVFKIFTMEDRGRDFRKIVNWYNLSLAYAKDHCNPSDFQFALADDIELPPDYCEYLIGKMQADPKLVVTSGRYDEPLVAPSGAGRMLRDKFLRKIGYHYPFNYSYESYPLFKALQLGFKIHVFNEMKFDHLRPLGSGHGFREFGRAMYCLGYHPLFVLFRCLHLLPKLKLIAVLMLADYLFAPFSSDNLINKQDEHFCKLVALQHKRMIRSFITRPILNLIYYTLVKLKIITPKKRRQE